VTGSGRNIGRATVLKLAGEGAHVVVPLGRQGSVDEIAATCLFLVSGGWRLHHRTDDPRQWRRSLLLIWSLTAESGAAADHDKEGRPGGGGRHHPAIDVRLTQSLGPEAPLSSLERSQSGTHAVFRAAGANRRLVAHPVDRRHLS